MESNSLEVKGHRFLKELLSDIDEMLIDTVRDFVDELIIPIRRELEQSARSDFKLIEDLQRKLVPLGFQSGFLPEEYGGMGLTSVLTASILAEEFGRGDASFFCAPAGGFWAMRPAIFAENTAVLGEFAPRFLGEDLYIACFAMTEPHGGCNVENMDMHGLGITTRARLDGNEWVINGSKVWPTNSGIADLYLVVCNTDPRLGDEGIALIYVPVPIDGFSFGRFEDKAGFRGSREGDFNFENVRVPNEFRASGPGRDAELLHDNVVFARIFSGAWATGCAQGAFDEVLSFTKDRLAAGKPIRQHTIAAGILADIAIGIQVGRDAYVNVAYMYDHPEVYGARHSKHMLSRSSIAKVFCADAAVTATNKAMELMGSYGYVTDYHVEKYWRDVKIIQLWEGGAQLGRLDVARGIYEYDQFYRNEMYETLSVRREKDSLSSIRRE
ncbi:MAG: acyl-CoA dehydrogenase family protein [Desulfomonilia bacterium]